MIHHDLDDVHSDALWAELVRRAKAYEAGACDYCTRPRGVVPSCKHAERHSVSGPGPHDLGRDAVLLVLAAAVDISQQHEDGAADRWRSTTLAALRTRLEQPA